MSNDAVNILVQLFGVWSFSFLLGFHWGGGTLGQRMFEHLASVHPGKQFSKATVDLTHQQCYVAPVSTACGF